MKKIIVIYFLIHSQLSNAFVTVGTDGACLVSPVSLESAAINNDEVRITNQQAYDAIDIINHNAHIIGGFNNCTDANNNVVSNTNSVISGNNSNTTISILTTAAGGHTPRTVMLENIDIINGSSDGTNIAAGINIVGNLDVTINNTEIRNNQSSGSAGGIYISGQQGAQLSLNNTLISNNSATLDGGALYATGSAEITLNDVEVANNSAKWGAGISIGSNNNKLSVINSTIRNNIASSNGGGIYCLGVNNLNLTENNLIQDNTAVLGGGVFLSSSCSMLFKGGDNSELNNILYGINDNIAQTLGGGIFVGNQARIDLIGSADHYVNITNNVVTSGSTSQGGGIFVTDVNSYVKIINGRISGNSADNGAALYARGSGHIEMRRSSGSCFGNQICSEISNNQTLFAGTIATESCGMASIYQTNIHDNTAGSDAVARFEGNNLDNCQSVLEGNLIYSNKRNDDGSTRMISLNRKVELEFAFNTMTDNNATNNIVMLDNSGSTQTLKINSSIIWDAPAIPVSASSPGNTFSGNCFAVHDASNLPAEFGPIIGGNDPLFTNPAINDYSTTDLSPYSDYCDTSLYSPRFHDIIGTVRGHAWLPPVLGPYDMGAFEYDDVHFNNVIFQDGFD